MSQQYDPKPTPAVRFSFTTRRGGLATALVPLASHGSVARTREEFVPAIPEQPGMDREEIHDV